MLIFPPADKKKGSAGSHYNLPQKHTQENTKISQFMATKMMSKIIKYGPEWFENG